MYLYMFETILRNGHGTLSGNPHPYKIGHYKCTSEKITSKLPHVVCLGTGASAIPQ